MAYGTTNIPVNTFNKVWIVPEKAVVYENAKAGTAYVMESRLKVMLEQDYLSLEKHEGIQNETPQGKSTNQLGSQIVREIVIPELTNEVNEGKNFIQLRQVYNSLILAIWYKKKIKYSILSQVYSDKNKVVGVNIDDPQEKEKIYQRYLQAFKKGVYNYIKEEQNPVTQEVIPRKYFSGGVTLVDSAMFAFTSKANQDVPSNRNKVMITVNLRGYGSDNVKPVNDMAMGSRIKIDSGLKHDVEEIYNIYDVLVRNNGSSLGISKERMFKRLKFVKKFQGTISSILTSGILGAYGGYNLIDPYNNDEYLRMIMPILTILSSGLVLYLHYSRGSGYRAGRYNPLTKNIVLKVDEDDISHNIAHEMAHMFGLPRNYLLANTYSRLAMIKMGYEGNEANIQVSTMADIRKLKRENQGLVVASVVSSIVTGSLKEREVVIRNFWKQYRKYKDDDYFVEIIQRVQKNIKSGDYSIPKIHLEEGWCYPYGETMAWLAVIQYRKVDDALQFIYNFGKLGSVELAAKSVDNAQISLKQGNMNRQLNHDETINERNDKGGIDLTPANMNLQTQNNGGEIKFHLDQAMVQQLQNTPGFVPVITKVQPANLRAFFGLTDNQAIANTV